jgi:predicted permease
MLNELWSDLRYRLRAILWREAVERDLDDELRFHIERQAEKYVAEGMSPAEAIRRARIAFGGVSRIKDDTRDARGTAMLEHLIQDLRYAIRGLRARPGFTTIIVATVALGVGANAAMFGVLDRLLFRAPAHLIDPPLVHRVYLGGTTNGIRNTVRRIEFPTYADLANGSSSFSAAAAFAYRDEAVGSDEGIEEVVVAAVTSSFFDFFSARPVIGRFFVQDEDMPSRGAAVVVLAHSYWQSRYGGRRDVIGTALRIGRETYIVIGVAPPRFEGISDQRAPAAFVPVTTYGATMRPNFSTAYSWSWLEMIVRRRPDIALEVARADLNQAYLGSWRKLAVGSRTYPTFEAAQAAQAHATLAPIQLARGPHAGPDSKVVKWLSAVAFIVLLIACANVATLLILRALQRRRELALRTALGATRPRIVQQLFTETLTLAVLGGVGGLMAAQWGGGVLRRLFLDANGSTDVLGDSRTLTLAIAVTLAIAMIAGLAPALQSGGVAPGEAFKAGSRNVGYRRSRTRSSLVVAQATLSVVLLVGGGLFVSSLRQLRAIRLGYDVDPVIYVRIRFREPPPNAPQLAHLTNRLVEAAGTIPGVMSATPVISVPFLGGERQTLHVPGVDSVDHLGRFSLQAGSPDYFATMGTRILRGRGIERTDVATAPRVAVVSEAMAQALWPGREAIGQCFRIRSDTVPCTTIVGIAENVRMHSLTATPEFTYYLPEVQYHSFSTGAVNGLFVRVDDHGADLVETVRRELQRIMPGSSYVVAMPLQQLVDPSMRSWETGAMMFLAFGALALALAAIGLYSTIAFGVAQRTQELGVRIALGAAGKHVMGLILGEGLRLTVMGIVVGGAIAFAASPSLSPLLFRVSPRSPAVYAIAALTLLAVGALASALPAFRAARVDPNRALKAE